MPFFTRNQLQSAVEYSSIGASWKILRAGTIEKKKTKLSIFIPSVFAAIIIIFTIYAVNYNISLRKKYSTVQSQLEAVQSALATVNEELAQRAPDRTKIATILESRPLANLVPLVLYFSAILGSRWPIRIFHSSENAFLLHDSPYIKRMVTEGRVELQMLPLDVNFTRHETVSAFLTTSWLWEQLAPATEIFIFQVDSILCANSRRTVDDFLGYDFIGAPFHTNEGFNYNGGLSIRNRKKILDITQRYNRVPNSRYEDTWFVERLRQLPPKPSSELGVNLPSLKIASQFSVETIWKEKPFGLHQISRWHPEKLKELELWCPESHMVIEGSLHPNYKTGWTILDVEEDYDP